MYYTWFAPQVILVNEDGDSCFLIFIYEDRDWDIVNALIEKGYKIKQENSSN